MLRILSAGFIAATAMLATPAMAGWEATQEPGVVGFNYPDSHYLTGGYGARSTPGLRFYYRHGFAPGAAVDAPVAPYGYYGGPGWYYGD